MEEEQRNKGTSLEWKAVNVEKSKSRNTLGKREDLGKDINENTAKKRED